MTQSDVVRRLRVIYEVRGPLRYVSVLDMGQIWERLLRRAGVPVAYSKGYNPRPRLQLGSPLPVGYSSECEVLDIYLTEPVEPRELWDAVAPQTPRGLVIRSIREIPVKAPAPQAETREALYQVRTWTRESAAEVAEAAERLLAEEHVVRQRYKKGRMVDYDLRPLVLDIKVLNQDGDAPLELEMHVQCGPQGAGRPEEILDELGLTDARYTIHRTRLITERTRMGDEA